MQLVFARCTQWLQETSGAARFYWRAAATVLALVATWSAYYRHDRAPPRQPLVFYSPSPHVQLPFNGMDTSASDVELLVSRDAGKTWSIYERRSNQRRLWQLRLPGDGAYWLAFRAVDSRGQPSWTARSQADFIAVVDAIAPAVTMDLTRPSEDRVVCVFHATDSHLASNNLEYSGWCETPEGERIGCQPQQVVLSPLAAGVQGRLTWLVPSNAGRFVVRIVARDAANHVTVREKITPTGASRVALESAAPEPRTGLKAVQLAAHQSPSKARQRTSSEPRLAPKPPVPTPPVNRVGQSGPELLPPLPAEELPPVDDQPGPNEQRPSQQRDIAAEIQLRAARNSVALGDIPEALTRFQELLQLRPQDDEVRFEYAGLLLQDNQFEAGRNQLEQLVAERPQVAAYRLELADVLLRLKEYEAARTQLQWLLSDPSQSRQAAIKLARSYILDHRLAEARQVFEEYLQNSGNLKPTDRQALASLLIDMDDPSEAVRLLLPLHEAQQGDESVSTTLVLAYVRLNQRLKALELIPALEQQPFQKIGPWLDLASQLYREQAFPEALAIFQQIVRQEPQHYQASLKLARTHLRLYEVDIAGQILTELSCDPQDREFSTVMADYHTMVGEYSEAIAIAKRRLRQDETDLEALILLGNAYQASGQLLFAGAVYQSALAHCVVPDQEQRREILRLLAGNHFLSRRFDQAAQILEALLQEQPTDIASRILLVENWLEAKNFPAAEELTCSAEKLTSARDRFALRTQYAYVLLEQGRFGEALNEFQTLAADPSGCVPDVAYGFYRSAKKLKQPESVREALALGPSPIAPAAVWGVGFADRALSYCDCCSAAAVLDDALCHAPKNLVLLIRRGEAAQQCDCDCSSLTCESCFPKIAHIFGDSDAVPPPAGDQWFSQALQLSPTNIRARLGLARVLSQHLEYDAAYAEYLNLMKFMPQDINIAREAARMVAGWQGIERAGGLYERADVAAGGEVVGVSREMPSEEGFGVRQLVGAGPGEVEVPVSELLDTEHRAKYLRGWRFRKAIPFYESLIDQEPTNEEALFDLAQTYSALNRTQCAIDTYRRLLEINPCHQDAATALVRNELELRPKLIGTFDFQNQVGRQGLANITWENYSVSERQTLGDENEYFEWGYTQRVLHPTDGADDVGQVPFLHWQEKFYNDNYFFLDLAVEQYQYGMDTRPTFNTGFRLNSDEDAELGVSGFLKNYYANGEAILQDIYWGGIQIDGVVRPLRLWTLSGYYRATAFSDHNAANWFNINSAHMLIQGRRQLRGIIDYDFYSFANQTIFGPIPGNLAGTIHPYWAPSGYSFVTTGLEWKHWLSCDTFKGGNEHWYMLYFAGAVDSNGQGYFVFNSRWQRDLANWMTWNIDVNLTRSQKQVYDAVGVLASLVIRIP